jgi:hypothetical protein
MATSDHLKGSNSGRAADDEVEELSFEDAPPPRTGDPLTPEEIQEEFPLERESSAGMSGGELLDTDISDDDLTPETLFDEEAEYEVYPNTPADKVLRVVDGDEIGGTGKDESELAR